MTSGNLSQVLCVNDNDIALFILRHTLKQANFAHHILCMKDASEADIYLERLLRTESDLCPAVIFLDLHMPVMDGWEFLKIYSEKYHSKFPELKIVITSYSVDESDAEKVKQYPFVIDFMKDGITIDYLNELKDQLSEFA